MDRDYLKKIVEDMEGVSEMHRRMMDAKHLSDREKAWHHTVYDYVRIMAGRIDSQLRIAVGMCDFEMMKTAAEGGPRYEFASNMRSFLTNCNPDKI